MAKYNESIANGYHNSQKNRAQLYFSITRSRKVIHTYISYNYRISRLAPVYLAAILQTLVHEILKLADEVAVSMNKLRIKRKHIVLAIRNDLELSDLFPKSKVYI